MSTNHLKFKYRKRQAKLWCWGNTTKDVTAENLGASRSIVIASNPILCALKIVNAWTAKIMKGVKREELFCTETMLMLRPTSNRRLIRSSMGPLSIVGLVLHQPRREELSKSLLDQHPTVNLIIKVQYFKRYPPVRLREHFFPLSSWLIHPLSRIQSRSLFDFRAS